MEKSESESRSVVSNSLWTHRLHSPWNSPGQNTAVGNLSLSRGSSQPKDWTQVSHIAGTFFTSWATVEAYVILKPAQQDFPGGAIDKNLPANCRFNPWSWKISYAAEEWSPCSTSTEPLSWNYQAHVLQLLKLMHLEPVLCSKRRKARKKNVKKNMHNSFLLNIFFLSPSPNLPLPPRKPQTLFLLLVFKANRVSNP